jgi:hypothetical protein
MTISSENEEEQEQDTDMDEPISTLDE